MKKSKAVQPHRLTLLDISQSEQHCERNKALTIPNGRQRFRRIVNLCDKFFRQGDRQMCEVVSVPVLPTLVATRHSCPFSGAVDTAPAPESVSGPNVFSSDSASMKAVTRF